MPYRKPFYRLSDRQKRRRLVEEVENDLVDLDTELDDNADDELLVDESIDCEDMKSFVENNQIISTKNNGDGDDVEQSFILKSDENDYLDTYSNPYEHFLYNLNLQDEIETSSEIDSSDEDISSDKEILSDVESLSDDEICPDDEEGSDFKNALREWKTQFFISSGAMDKLLCILRDAGHSYLPKSSRTFLKTPKKTIVTQCLPGEYFHYGLETSLKDILARDSSLNKAIVIDVNVDGLPITKSTKRTLWPIQAKIFSDTSSTPFVIGVYHGTAKPSSATTFLTPFVEEYTKLNMHGFLHNNKRYFVKMRCVICDAPAASFVTCTKQHNGYFGCRKCMEEGTFTTRMLYLHEDAQLRTDENFRRRTNDGHHLPNDVSPFENLQINMVNQFPLDYMHLVCLGVTKLLITMWLKETPKFSAYQTEQLSTALTDLGKYVPKEFNRKPSSLLDLGRWKATNFRFFLLYGGPVILSDHLPKDIVLHFNYLSCAIRILCNSMDYKRNNEFAKKLLLSFVKEFKTLYGKKHMTYNVHNLIHLSTDAKQHGPLDSFSAFDFENYMKFIKKLLRKNEKPLQQIHRRLAEQHYPSNKRQNKLQNFPLLLSRINTTLPFNCSHSHRRLKFQYFEITNRAPDNCCILEDNIIIIVDYIGKQRNEIVVIGRKFLQRKGVQNYPIDSKDIGVYEVDKLSSLEVFSTQSIKNKACLFLDNRKHFVTSLLHY